MPITGDDDKEKKPNQLFPKVHGKVNFNPDNVAHLPIEKREEIQEILNDLANAVRVLVLPIKDGHELRINSVDLAINVTHEGKDHYNMNMPLPAIVITPQQYMKLSKVFQKK